ncbi:TonB-dependent receptor [Duganella sp. FT3S]|uniref:TonB-dependent receptor n=1 Tax=Rugamonas fusca TaxID=2758568 RepID=A0A7W2I5A5_9BURK|nr:TonB-dependent receptor plug domain-containing protein [Rugamonas fusca]MBA5604236.1 TonB-dependent receptor [Rugamonas fusca]
MKRQRHPLTLAVSLAFAGGACAQTATVATVIVTAHPIIEDVRVDPYSSTTAVLTEGQLRDQNAVDLASALRRTPGVQISRYNPVGAFGGDQGGAIFIRGMGVSRPGSEIKTEIDGVPFYMGLWSHPLLDLLPVNGMRTITVYKSPQPQVSGNNFASVNLETKRATEDGVHGSARVSAGAFGTVIEQADLLGRAGKLDFALAQGHAQSDGHRAHADGELNNAMGRLGWKLDENWSLGASFLAVDNKASDPGDSRLPAPTVAAQYNTRASMIAAYLSHQHGDWRGEVKVYRDSGEGNWLHQAGLDGDTPSNFRMSGLRWKEQFSPWQGGTVMAGLDDDRISGDVKFNRIAPAPQASFDAPTFRITSPYASASQNVVLNADWSLLPSAGVRFYKHSEFESRSAPHVGLSLVSDKLTVFANLSRGINYPGLEVPTLASLIPPLGTSWKQLSPEELDHAEIGAKLSPGDSTQIDASLFNDKVNNRYVFGFPPDVPPPPQFMNLGAYRMKGAELAIRQGIASDWTLFGGLTLLDPSIDHLPYTPKRALTVGVNGKVGPFSIAFDAQYQSQVWALNRARAAGAVNSEQVSGFAVANLRIAYPLPALGKKGEVFLALENLFDRDYAYRPGYTMPGRWGQVGLAASF